VAIIYGAAGEEEYSDEVVRNPEVIALRDRVSAAAEPGVHEDQVRVTVKLKDGRTLEKYVEHTIGSLGKPMSDAALEAKFRSFANGILSQAETDKLIRLCWDIARLRDAGEVARASVPAVKASNAPRENRRDQ